MDSFPSELSPSRITSIDTEFSTKVVQFENGCEQRYASRKRPVKTFEFEWEVLNLTEQAALATFFEAQLGAFKRWQITDDRLGGTVTVRFADDKLAISKINAHFADVKVKVKTC